MKVIVTGASTPLGQKVIEQLGCTPEVTLVLAVDKERSRQDGGGRGPVLHCAVDLSRRREAHDLVWGLARERSIDTIIHAAQHRAAADEGKQVHRQNVETTRHLLDACTGHVSIRRFVLRSFAEVYATAEATTQLLTEADPLDFDPGTPQWVRDRVEADLTAGSHVGPPLRVAVLRCAEVLAPGSGSQLWDYLSSRVCLRPAGFDPMINVLSLEDAAAALVAAARSSAVGAFNITGADTLPLSRAIAASERLDIAIPGHLMSPLYRLRRKLAGFEFRYDLNVRKFHLGGVLDGTRAREHLGYVPTHPVVWPRPWWRVLLERLAMNDASAGV